MLRTAIDCLHLSQGSSGEDQRRPRLTSSAFALFAMNSRPRPNQLLARGSNGRVNNNDVQIGRQCCQIGMKVGKFANCGRHRDKRPVGAKPSQGLFRICGPGLP